MRHDPVEDSVPYRATVAQAEAAAWAEVAADGIEPGTFGSCRAFWPAKHPDEPSRPTVVTER